MDSRPPAETPAPAERKSRIAEDVGVERRLLWRLGGVAAALVALAVVAAPLVHRHLGRNAFEGRARSLAATVAAGLVDASGEEAIAARLRTALADPDVLTVEAFGPDGGTLAAAPPDGTAGTRPAEAGERLAVREPVVGAGSVAEVRVTLSTAGLAASVRRTWLRSVLAGMLLLGVGLLVVDLLVRDALAPLRRLSGDARRSAGGAVAALIDSIGRKAEDLERRADSLESLLERLLAHVPAAAVVFDAAGRSVRSNRRALPGSDAPVRPGTSVQKAWVATGMESGAWAAELHARCLQERRPLEREVEIPDPRGGARHAATRWVPLPDGGDGSPGVLLIAEETTERVRSRAALEERDARLSHAERLEVVGRLAGSVAHDFNNLLTVIVGFNDLLSMGVAPDSPEAEDLEEIRRAAERGSALTARLLGFARTAPAEAVDPIDPVAAVRQVRGMVERIVGEGVVVEVEAEEDLGLIRLDPVRLDQVVLNLASNARDAMPGGGRLTIRLTSAERGEPAPGRESELLERAVVISVSDTGTGMDEETVSRIFDAFFTTKTEGKGTGLGLATVQEIVSGAGGFVDVESELGEGTTFHLHLPREPEETPGAGEETPAVRETRAAPRGERVLVVDDEEPILRLVRRVLEARGYRVAVVDDPRRAVGAAAEGPPPDLAVIDVAMPGLSGPRLAERLRERHPHIEVLFTSGHAEEALRAHGIDAAGKDFLQKPFTPEALAWRVRELLDADGSAG